MIDLRGLRIGVTGATGFLGRYFVEALLRSGASVVGVVRNPARVAALLDRPGLTLRRADLLEPDTLQRAFVDLDALVSNAALYSLGQLSWDEHQRTNVQGTRHVLEAAARARLTRVIHVSSVAVYRSARGGRLVDEDAAQYDARTTRLPHLAYPVSKALSEQLAWELAAAHDLQLTTLRPCAVYGAFDPNLTPWVERLARWPLTVAPAGLRMNFVYAGDVAEALCLALGRPVSIGRPYNITGEDFSFYELVRAFQRAYGHTRAFCVPLPAPFRRRFDNHRAKAELGFSNRPLDAGAAETLALEGDL